MAMTVYVVKCKYSPGMSYFTTDIGQVQAELDLAREEGYPDDEITYETRIVSNGEYKQMLRDAAGKEFPGW